jgi:hypothetical protein
MLLPSQPYLDPLGIHCLVYDFSLFVDGYIVKTMS